MPIGGTTELKNKENNMKNNKIKILFNHIAVFAKIKIKELAKTELNNTEKKEKLDKYIVKIIEKTMDNLGFNFVARFAINNYLLPYVDDITQYIYDLLKSRLDSQNADNSVKTTLNPINEI